MSLITFLQTFASPPLDAFVLLLTNLGSQDVYIAMIVVIYLAFSARVGQRLGIGLLLSFYINQQAKAFFDTVRPFVLEPSLLRSEAAGETALGAAFPSGHAQGATTFWLLAAYYAKRRWFWGVASALVLVIALSRIYLGVHFPVDIVGGVLLGIAVLLAALWGYGVADTMSGVPIWTVCLAGVGVPLLFHSLYPTVDSGLILGGMAAFITGPQLFKHHVPTKLWQRVVLALIGVVLVFAALLGSSVLLPESLKRSSLGSFTRYLLLGYVGTILTPWLARAFKLSPAAHSKTPTLTRHEAPT